VAVGLRGGKSGVGGGGGSLKEGIGRLQEERLLSYQTSTQKKERSEKKKGIEGVRVGRKISWRKRQTVGDIGLRPYSVTHAGVRQKSNVKEEAIKKAGHVHKTKRERDDTSLHIHCKLHWERQKRGKES